LRWRYASWVASNERSLPWNGCKAQSSGGRVQSGLNKGEAKNALARAVFFNRLGEMRDRSFENQRYRASGLTLVVAAPGDYVWRQNRRVESRKFRSLRPVLVS
jgi:hypothetical protein